MQADDNPLIGLLLCTEYGETTVQYATEGLSQNLFVSKYQLQLPSEEEMRQYLIESATAEDWEGYKREQEKGKRNVTCKVAQYTTALPSKELLQHQIHKGLEAARQSWENHTDGLFRNKIWLIQI